MADHVCDHKNFLSIRAYKRCRKRVSILMDESRRKIYADNADSLGAAHHFAPQREHHPPNQKGRKTAV